MASDVPCRWPFGRGELLERAVRLWWRRTLPPEARCADVDLVTYTRDTAGWRLCGVLELTAGSVNTKLRLPAMEAVRAAAAQLGVPCLVVHPEPSHGWDKVLEYLGRPGVQAVLAELHRRLGTVQLRGFLVYDADSGLWLPLPATEFAEFVLRKLYQKTAAAPLAPARPNNGR